VAGKETPTTGKIREQLFTYNLV